jgi:HEAT repeat protein
MSVATSARKPVADRVAALAEVPLAVCETDENLQAMLGILSNKDEAIEVRLAALQSLQAASFSVIAFESCRSDYIATLRKVATDPDPELRQRILGILARENDGFAQKKLLEGLQDSTKALVSPEKALQLLGYDPHAEAYSIAREIVDKPPSTTAKREALRLLAADTTAAPLFEKLLRDKDEVAEIRQISASALQAIKPDKLQEHAREILLDTSEFDDIQATSLTAITQFGDAEAVAKDETLLKRVDKLSNEASKKVKQGARQFLSKYGQ